MIGEMG